MKKYITLVVLVSFLLGTFAYAQPPEKPKRGGPIACLYGWFFGPRAGYMYNEGVGIRTMEWITLVFSPIGIIIQSIDIWGGTTWTEIEIKENLRDPEFKAWHKYMVTQEGK